MSFSVFPRTVYKTESKISGPIEVKEQLGNYTLHVDGLIQSGGIIEGIWKKPLKQVTHNKLHVTRCLVLGLGGGTVVQLIKARWPEAKIIGVEIDPEIIKIGKKYFRLNEIKNLEIINADAVNWVKRFYVLKHRNKKFDLIIVDLYIGDRFSSQVASNEFLKNLKKLLSKNGIIIFNRLISPSEDLEGFEEKLRNCFSKINKLDTRTNLFLFVN